MTYTSVGPWPAFFRDATDFNEAHTHQDPFGIESQIHQKSLRNMPTVRNLLLPLLLAMLVAACASQPRTPPSASHIRADDTAAVPGDIPPLVPDLLPLPRPTPAPGSVSPRDWSAAGRAHRVKRFFSFRRAEAP